MLPRAGRSLLSARAPQVGPSNLRNTPRFHIIPQSHQRRGYASEAPEYDVLFIGGGVAGYVGAIKAGQEGLKVCPNILAEDDLLTFADSMYREARRTRWYMPERRLHSLQIPSQQLPPVPSDITRHQEARH